MEQIYKPKNDYRVFVRCNTFNQSKYIENALKGFAMQQTNFPFVCLVMDDCSTDGEQEVIKAWMERECDMEKAEYGEIELSNIILVPHKLNSNCTFAFYLLKRNTWKERELKVAMYAPWRNHCEYEALCEGDDYWIEPLKLQSQADFLDKHLEYSMCFSNSLVHWQDEKKEDSMFASIEDRDYTGTEIMSKWQVATATVMHRGGVIDSGIYKEACRHKKIMYGDIRLFLSCAAVGKVRGMSDVFSVYRRLSSGAVLTMEKSNKIKWKLCEHVLELAKVFGVEYNEIADHLYTDSCVNHFFYNLKEKDLKAAFFFLRKAYAMSFIKTNRLLYHHITAKIK